MQQLLLDRGSPLADHPSVLFRERPIQFSSQSVAVLNMEKMSIFEIHK